jgi:hypothetical protein
MAKSSLFKWVWYMYQFDKYHPTTAKFLQSRWHHFHFCKRNDINITASIYLDTTAEELRNDLLKHKSTDLRTLVYRSFLDALADPAIRKEIFFFFDAGDISKETIRELQTRINEIRNPPPRLNEFRKPPVDAREEERSEVFYSKTYVVAAHLHFELAGKEPEYEALTRQIPQLEHFIRETFKTGKLPGTLSKFRGYSYKKILQGKNTGEKGQLRPVFRQIIDNPQIFGEPVARYAESLLREHLDS